MSATTALIVPADDLRHRVAEGVKTRDSLFWNIIIPDERIAVQLYIWIDGKGVGGRQVAVYVPDREKNIVRNAFNVDMGDAIDLDAWECDGLTLRQPEPLKTAVLTYDQDGVSFEYEFSAAHRPFSYAENPKGCPPWMAINRFEQTGTATGVLRVGDRTISFQDIWSHRDHSWGRRNWNWVHHWKWIVAGVPGGKALNTMFHIARGEPGLNGHILHPDGEPVPITDGWCEAQYDDDMSQRSLVAELTDARGEVTRLEMERFAIFHLPFGSDTLLSESACTVRIDGEDGTGQFETLWPKQYVDRLVSTE